MPAIDTGTTDLLAAQEGGVLTLTLNRPEARNAMSGDMDAALAEKLKWAELEPSVRCVVLTGAGGAFCAGGDVKGMASRNAGGQAPSRDVAIHSQRENQRATAGRLFKIWQSAVAATHDSSLPTRSQRASRST